MTLEEILRDAEEACDAWEIKHGDAPHRSVRLGDRIRVNAGLIKPRPTCLHDFLDPRSTLTLQAHWALGVRVRCEGCSQVREIMQWEKLTQANPEGGK